MEIAVQNNVLSWFPLKCKKESIKDSAIAQTVPFLLS